MFKESLLYWDHTLKGEFEAKKAVNWQLAYVLCQAGGEGPFSSQYLWVLGTLLSRVTILSPQMGDYLPTRCFSHQIMMKAIVLGISRILIDCLGFLVGPGFLSLNGVYCKIQALAAQRFVTSLPKRAHKFHVLIQPKACLLHPRGKLCFVLRLPLLLAPPSMSSKCTPQE